MQSRRNFLKSSLAAPVLMGGGSLLGTLTGFSAQATAQAADYKALVCVFLEGGMDCHDTVIPYDQPSYARYAELRASLLDAYANAPEGSSRDRAALLPLSPANATFGGREFALAPQLAGLADLFQRGHCAVVGNVGPLREPTSRNGFELNSTSLPSRLFSHNDQRYTWMSFAPEGAQSGWAGHFSDATIGAGVNPLFSQVSLFGYAAFLHGEKVAAYQMPMGAINTTYVPEIHSSEEKAMMREHLTAAGISAANLFEQDFIDITRVSLEANDQMRLALESSPPLTTSFPTTSLGEQLQTVARVISSRDSLAVNRQVFLVGLRGFDTHSNQSATLPELQKEVGDAIAAFYTATEEMGLGEQVTTLQVMKSATVICNDFAPCSAMARTRSRSEMMPKRPPASSKTVKAPTA